MFDYSSLEALRAVESEGTYGRAAQNLGITRSAISQKISLLEDRWGSTITSRKPVRTTKHGKRLCRHIDQVHLLESKLNLNAGHLFDAFEIEPHPIKLLFDKNLLQTGFLDDLSLYVETQNDFDFEVIRASSLEIQSEIRPDKVIAAINSNWIQSTKFKVHQLGARRFLAVAHPDFASRNFSCGFTPAAFRSVNCVVYDGRCDHASQFLDHVFGQAVETNCIRLHSNSGVLRACLQQKCWAILPDLCVSDLLKTGHLVELFPGKSVSINLYLFVSRYISKVLPEVAATVLEAAKHNLDPAT